MAVVPMQKVQLLVHRSDIDAALTTIQRYGAFEFRTTTIDELTTPNLVFPHANILPRVQHAVHFLEPYAPKVSMWRSLRDGATIDLTEADAQKVLADTDAITAVVEDLERLQVEFAETQERLRGLVEQRELLATWKNLPFKLGQLETATTITKLIKTHTDIDLAAALQTMLTESEIPFALTPVTPQAVAVTIPKDTTVTTQLGQLIASVDAELCTMPNGTETADVELTKAEEQLAKAQSDLALLHDQAEHIAITHLQQLKVASEILSWQQERYSVVSAGAATNHLVILSGWITESARPKIAEEFVSKEIAAILVDVELDENEEPPVDIVNNSLTQPFEIVTRLYGMPGYKDLDPTVFLAGFFFLFFGLSLTDVGYGLALVLAAVFILLFTKLDAGTKLFAKLLLFIGTATVLVGALFGGYLGFDTSSFPEPLQRLQQFDPINNPLPVFYLALSLGVFQVMVGMLLMIYSAARNGKLIDGLLDQVPWLLMFSIGILYVLTMVGWVNIISTNQIGNLALLAAVLIVVASGRNGDGIVGKIIAAAGGLYAGVGYFSDILSYSRLLALGLATSALAYAVNLIADMLSDIPYVGFILSFAILLIGHLFTLAINTLGAFVHSARLQFVEFFGKFIVGTGKEFSPLKRTNSYVTIVDD